MERYLHSLVTDEPEPDLTRRQLSHAVAGGVAAASVMACRGLLEHRDSDVESTEKKLAMMEDAIAKCEQSLEIMQPDEREIRYCSLMSRVLTFGIYMHGVVPNGGFRLTKSDPFTKEALDFFMHDNEGFRVFVRGLNDQNNLDRAQEIIKRIEQFIKRAERQQRRHQVNDMLA